MRAGAWVPAVLVRAELGIWAAFTAICVQPAAGEDQDGDEADEAAVLMGPIRGSSSTVPG
jgi:hypothetical protein